MESGVAEEEISDHEVEGGMHRAMRRGEGKSFHPGIVSASNLTHPSRDMQ